VGHPILDEIAYSEDNRNDALVGVFPGSRERELRAHLPVLRELAARLKKSESCLRLLFAASSAGAKRIISSELPDAEFAEGPWLRQHAACGVVCSGTATLEAAMAGLPMCVIYRVAWPTYLMGRWLIKVPHLAMPNILAGRELVKELIQGALTPHALEEELLRLTGDQSYRRSIQTGYREIRGKMGEVGAATRAAREILEAAKP
jgi:lipid-A-disaccharide synthase